MGSTLWQSMHSQIRSSHSDSMFVTFSLPTYLSFFFSKSFISSYFPSVFLVNYLYLHIQSLVFYFYGLFFFLIYSFVFLIYICFGWEKRGNWFCMWIILFISGNQWIVIPFVLVFYALKFWFNYVSVEQTLPWENKEWKKIIIYESFMCLIICFEEQTSSPPFDADPLIT